MRKLFAEVINRSGHTVTMESRSYPAITVESAYDAPDPQRFPVRDEAHFEALKDHLHRALPHCKGIAVTLIDETPVVITVSLSASPDSVVADGSATSELTVTVLSDGKPAEGQLVELSATAGALSAATGTTDALGKVVATIHSDQAGEVTATATAEGHVATAKVTFTEVPTKKTTAKAAKPKAEEPAQE